MPLPLALDQIVRLWNVFLFSNYIQIFQKKNKCLSKQIFIKKKQIDLKISNTA